jgi:putative nucleotidyltransferase with HDIG domain
MTALRAAAISVVDDLFENPTPENIHRSSKIVASFVHVLMKDPKAFLHLTKLSSHDPYTLQHSVGAAVNSIIIARKIGIKSEKDLGDVGLGGLLHDIGKVAVRKEIINKPGPLDELEWEEMRQHVVEGYALVKDNPQVSELTKRAILEHHEDKMKSGYPARLAWTNVHLFSKIVGTSDIFNALTTNRSYSLAKTAFDALALMKEKMSHKIDDEIYRAMVLIYAGKIDDLLGQSSPAPGPAKTGGSKG